MAVTLNFPQLLASGSTDGEICLWNTSSELFIRRLNQRKRNLNNTQAKVRRKLIFVAICYLINISYKTMQLILLLQH